MLTAITSAYLATSSLARSPVTTQGRFSSDYKTAVSSSDSSSESIKPTATAHDAAGSVKTTDSVFTATSAHRPASLSGSVSNPLAASVSTHSHASGSAGPSATISINDMGETGEYSVTSMGLSGSVKSAASTHATGMHSLPSLHSSATAMNATTAFPARSSLTGSGKGTVAANASAASTTANPGSVSVVASPIGMDTTSFNYASSTKTTPFNYAGPTVQDSASASIANSPILLPASTPTLVNTLPPWTDSIIPAHSLGGITDIAPARTTLALSSSMAATNLTLDQQLTAIVDDMGKSTNLGMFENDLVYFQQLFPTLNFTELATFVKDSARNFAGYMLLEGIEAFAQTLNGTFTNATFPNATFPDVARHYFDIVAAGVDDIIHEFNTTIAPDRNTSSTTVAPHHRSKRMILSEPDFLSRISRLIEAEEAVTADDMVPQLMEFLRGFSAMRKEFTLTVQRGVAGDPDAIALANQLRQPLEMANHLQQYESEVFELLWSNNFEELGRLVFKVNALSYFSAVAPPQLRDMMESLRLMVSNMIQYLQRINLGTTNPSTFTVKIADLTNFCLIWNPLRLMLRNQQLAEGVCLADVVSLTVASQEGISVSSSLNTLVNAIFLGAGYARLPALVRTILQEIALKNSASSPVSLWRTLGLKSASYYLSKIHQKFDAFSLRSNGSQVFLTIQSMLSKMVAAFNAKAAQLPAGEDVTVLFSVDPRTEHVIFAKMQRVNNQLSLTTSDIAGYLLSASADSMEHLVARAMRMLRPLAQQYGLGLTQPAPVANGLGIGHLYEPTDAEIAEWADLAPIPTSALTLKQILTKPVTELEALDKAATKALAKEYIHKVTSADGLKKLKLSQKLTEQDLLPAPSSLKVTTADPLIMQMREVISVLDDALASNVPVPDAVKILNAHIMAKTSHSLLARAKATAGEQPDPVPGPSGVAQGVSNLDDFQYSMQMMVLQDAINAIAPEVPGAALLAHPSAGAVPQSSGGQPSGGTDEGLSAATKAGIAVGSVGGTLGTVASGAFIKRLASNGGDAAAEDLAASVGESATEEFVPETEVLKSLGDGLKTNVEELMKTAPAPPDHDPGGKDWTHDDTGNRGKGSRGRGRGSRGKGKSPRIRLKEPACRRKRAVEGTGRGCAGPDELYRKAIKRLVAEGVVGISAPTLMASLAEMAAGLLGGELIMIIAAAVGIGVTAWVGYEVYEFIEEQKDKNKGDDDDSDVSSGDGKPTGHDDSSGGSGNRGTAPTSVSSSVSLTTGRPPVTGLQPATGRPGSNPEVVTNSSNPVTPQIAPGNSSLVPPGITASEASLTTALWSDTAAPALVAGLSSSASPIGATPRQSESTRAQALSANTTVPIGAESSSSVNTIKTSLSPSEMASSQSVSSSTMARISPEMSSSMNTTEASLSPSGMSGTQRLSSSTTAPFSPELSSSMNTTDVSMTPSGMAGTQTLSSNTTTPFSPELSSLMNTTDVSMTPSGMASTQTQTLLSNTAAPFSPELSSSMNATDVSMTPSGMASTQTLSSNTTAPFSPELSSSMNTTDVSMTPSGMASTQTLSSNTTALFSPELSSSMNTTDVSVTPSGMASTQALSSNTTAPFSPGLSSSVNTTDVSLTPSGMASTEALSSNTTAPFSPELSSSMNTTDVSLTPSGMASTEALSSNTTAPFSPEPSSSMNTTDVSMTPSGMASTQTLSSNTTAPFSPELSSSMNTTDVSMTPSGMASTQTLSSSTTAPLSPEMSSSIDATEASENLSETTKEPSTSKKIASSAAQTTSTATLPSSSTTDDAETDTARQVSSTPAQPVATPTTSPVTESHQEPMGPQDRKLLKLYADRGQQIHEAYTSRINVIENNNAQAMEKIKPGDEEIEINGKTYLKWPVQRLLCCAHGLQAMDRQLRDNFLIISSLARQCIRYDASHDPTMQPGATVGHPAREAIIADLVNQFLNMYAQYGEARFNMIKATDFALDETAESEIFQGFNARSMDSTVNALLHQPSGLSAPFRDFLRGLADSLDHEPQDNDLRAPRPNRHLLQTIHNTTVADDEFTLPQARLDPGDVAATNRIIRAEQARFIANMGELEDREYFPIDYQKIFQNPADYEAVFQGQDTMPCHLAEPGLADISALTRLLSPPQLSTSQPSTSQLSTSTSQIPTAHLEATPSAFNDRTDAESSSPTIVPSQTAQPVAASTASVTDSRPPQMGPQGKKLLKLYTDRGQAIQDRNMRQINGIKNNNVWAIKKIEPGYEKIEIHDGEYPKWSLQRLVCCAHGLRAMDKLLRDNFLTISSLAQQCISYDASRGLTMNPQAPGESPAREIIIDNLVNRFLNMYSQLAQARSEMILATGFPKEETSEAGLFRGFNAQGMDNTVNALLRDASGVSASFREVLEGVAGYLGRQIKEERLDDGDDLRTPELDEQLLSVIHNTTVVDNEFTLPSGWLERGDLDATNRIIQAESDRFITRMGVYRKWEDFPVNYREILENPTDYDAVFPNDDTAPCHYSESGLDDTSALEPLLSRRPATSPFTLTERKLLKGYAYQTTAVYADYAQKAKAIEQQNQEIMAAIPAEESDSMTWPEKRQVCCVNLLETLERQLRDSFLNMTSTAGQYLRYDDDQDDHQPGGTPGRNATEVSIIRNLANQFQNLYGLYSAARFDMVKATGFGGESAADDRFQGYNSGAVVGAVTGLLARSARMSAPIREVLRTLENALAHGDQRTNDRRPPQPDTALQQTLENVRVADDEFNLSPPMLDARDVTVINDIILAERKAYFQNTRALRDERFVMFSDVFGNTTDLQNQLYGEQLPCPTSEQGLADTSALSELLARAADQAPKITAAGKKLLKLYADRATQSYRAYGQRLSTIQSANTRAVRDIKKSDNTLIHEGREYPQWSLARLVCCAQGLQAMDRTLRNTFLSDLSLADQCIRHDASHSLTLGPDASGENPTREAMIDNLVNQFLNLYSQYGEARFNMIKATGFSKEEAAESPVFPGVNAQNLATEVHYLLDTTTGLSAPLRDVLRGVATYLDNQVTGDDDNDLRLPQADHQLLQIIDNTTVVDDEYTLPPATEVPGDRSAVSQLIRNEKVGYLTMLGELENREDFPSDFAIIFQQPDAYAEYFPEEAFPQCQGDSRKRRQLDSHLSGKPTPPRGEPANDHRDPATAGATRYGGVLSALRGGLSWLTGGTRVTADQAQGAAQITAGQSHQRQESTNTNNGTDNQPSASRVRPATHSVNDSLALAGLLVSRATDRPIQPDTLAHGERHRTDTAAQPFDCLPGMRLLTGSMRVARQLHSEVSAFLQQLNQQRIQPDAAWQTDDLLNMAIAMVTNQAQPTSCTEEFLFEVLFSPRLGVEHERTANIFDSDGRVRGTSGGAIFFGGEQTRPSQSGPARDLGQCMLNAMADRQLEQMTAASRTADAGPLLSGALRDAIVDRASQFQELQRAAVSARHSVGLFSQLPDWLGASSGNYSSRRDQLYQRLEQRLTPVTSPGAVQAGNACLSQLEAGDYGSARASFFALSDQQQQQAIQSLTRMPDCFGLEPQWDDPAPRDSQSAWQRFTALYDSKMGVQEEAMNRLKLMSMVSAGKVTGQYDEAQQLVAHIIDLLPTRDNASQRSCQETAECARPPVFQQHQYDRGTINDMLSAYKTIKAEVADQLPHYFINHNLDSDLQEEIITQVALGSLGAVHGKPAGQWQAEIAARLQTEAEEFAQTPV
ncbi:hypothetical protein [Endozoicomonas acroporae]|uniref:hypothetical protein n=1 Tax=Endozoicomonas acroporae TaxID=1701104 RepID=UPI003D7AD3FA